MVKQFRFGKWSLVLVVDILFVAVLLATVALATRGDIQKPPVLWITRLFADGSFNCTAFYLNGTWYTADHCVDEDAEYSIGLTPDNAVAVDADTGKIGDDVAVLKPKAKEVPHLEYQVVTDSGAVGFFGEDALFYEYHPLLMVTTRNKNYKGDVILGWLSPETRVAYWLGNGVGGMSGSPVWDNGKWWVLVGGYRNAVVFAVELKQWG